MTKQLDLPSQIGFQVSARTMQMLGRENVSSPIIALIEIVKNAYDADASLVTLDFQNTSSIREGVIRIEDDGEGMSPEDFIDKWMLISTANKKIKSVTRKRRVKVGEKGIGRLALDRLAHQTVVMTRRKGYPTLRLEIDWTKYEDTEDLLQEIKHPLSVSTDLQSPGTVLVLNGLRDSWTPKMYRDLYSDLSLLVPPFEGDETGFNVLFKCNEAPELSGIVSNPMPAAAEYKLVSTLTALGTIKNTLTYQPTGEVSPESKQWSEAFDDVAPETKPSCGPIKFSLYFYVRGEKERLKEMGVTSKDLTDFLKKYRGIRIYRDGFRVKPYGDPASDEDWLGLNARRVEHPGGVRSGDWRLAENQVVGTVLISREENPGLEDQTNREGLIQNQAYVDLRKFILGSILFLERERSERYQQEKGRTELDYRAVVTTIGSDLGRQAKKFREYADRIREKDPILASRLDSEGEEIERRANSLTLTGERIADEQTEKQMLIGLATLGIAVAAFGHETIRDVNAVLNRAWLLDEAIKSLPAKLRKDAIANLNKLHQSAERVSDWGHFALERIGRSKRVQKDLDINAIIENILHTFGYTLDQWQIDYSDLRLSKSLPKFRGFEMDIESILINFITNSMEAMRFTPLNHRKIQASTNYLDSEEMIRVRFCDSGKGIPEENVQKIFSPLYSTKVDEKGEPIGTGMGLTIIKDIIHNYGGEINVKGHGKIGGAEFEVFLPAPRATT